MASDQDKKSTDSPATKLKRLKDHLGVKPFSEIHSNIRKTLEKKEPPASSQPPPGSTPH